MSDEELTKLAQTNEKAVEVLLGRYKGLVGKIARRYFLICGELDDMVQEGMIALYKAIKTYDASKNASFKTFATLCITRKLQSAVRRASTQKSKTFLDLIDNETIEHFDTPSDKENPELNAISKQKWEHIKSEISARLSKFEKKILAMYLDGYSYQQIATDCGVAKKSVDNGLSRIRAKLFYLLDDTNY